MALGTFPTGDPDFHDAFLETGESDIDPISNHTPDTAGLSWTDCAGNADEAVLVAADDAVMPGNGGAFRYNGSLANISGGWSQTGDSNDHTVEATGAGGTPIRVFIMPFARAHERSADSRIAGYALAHNAGTNWWQLQRHDQGVTVLDNLLFDNAAADTDAVAVQAIGDGESAANLACYLNGTQIGSSYQDNTFKTGQPGFMHRKTLATVGLDNFKAWDEGGAAATPPFYSGLSLLGVGT